MSSSAPFSRVVLHGDVATLRREQPAIQFVYFLCWSSVFFIGLTIFSVPYVAMGYEMSDDYHERTRLMAVAQWIGQWAWVIAPWFWVILYDPTGLIAPPRAPVRCPSG